MASETNKPKDKVRNPGVGSGVPEGAQKVLQGPVRGAGVPEGAQSLLKDPLRGAGVPAGAQSLVKGPLKGAGVPEGAQSVQRGPLPVDNSFTPTDLGEFERVPVDIDMSRETSSRFGGCMPTEQFENVEQTGVETGGNPVHQSGASLQRAKTTIANDGLGQGIPRSDNLNNDVSVANSRGRRAAKVPSRLIVGNPKGWHFNRAKGR